MVAEHITAEKLKEKIDSGEDLYLVDVLSKNSYEAKHIPTAVNVPYSGDNFPKDFEEKVGAAKDAEIILHCSSETCQSSPNAAEKLKEAGYTNVIHFKRGLAGWQDAGYEFEKEA